LHTLFFDLPDVLLLFEMKSERRHSRAQIANHRVLVDDFESLEVETLRAPQISSSKIEPESIARDLFLPSPILLYIHFRFSIASTSSDLRRAAALSDERPQR
jgi:hypothetical protein